MFTRQTCKRKRKSSTAGNAIASSYEQLEPRQLLATLTVNISLDSDGSTTDGRISLREAVMAANTNAPFGDAPAGDPSGDEIVFAPFLDGVTLALAEGSIPITEGLSIRGYDLDILVDADNTSAFFNVNTDQQVAISNLKFINGSASLSDDSTDGIRMEGGGTLRLTDTTFHENSFDATLATIINVESNLRVLRSSFTGNIGNYGGAIHSTGGTTNIIGSSFSDGWAFTRGGAIYFEGGDHFISNSNFENNLADEVFYGGGSGGAIHIEGETTNVLIFGSSFINNDTQNGGAIANNGGRLVIRGGTSFTDNSARPVTFGHTTPGFGGFGGAIYNKGTLLMVEAQLQTNKAARGGGIYTSDNGQVTLNRAQIENNEAERGGGIAVVGGTLRTFETTVSLNEGRIGGGIAALDSGDPDKPSVIRFSGGRINNNSTTQWGGGIYNSESSFTYVFNGAEVFFNETVLSNPNGTAQRLGGGIYSAGVLQLHHSEVSHNSSRENGGGIHIENGYFNSGNSTLAGNSARYHGGGINVAGGRVRLFQSTIGGSEQTLGNRAGTEGAAGVGGLGGGVHVRGASGPAKFRMIGGSIENNVARLNGGGLAASITGNDLVLLESGVQVKANRALVNDGGGIHNNGATLEIRDSVFEENSARDGGGLFLKAGTTRLYSSTVQSNEARRKGGGIHNGTFMRLNDSPVTNNVAAEFSDIFDETI